VHVHNHIYRVVREGSLTCIAPHSSEVLLHLVGGSTHDLSAYIGCWNSEVSLGRMNLKVRCCIIMCSCNPARYLFIVLRALYVLYKNMTQYESFYLVCIRNLYFIVGRQSAKSLLSNICLYLIFLLIQVRVYRVESTGDDVESLFASHDYRRLNLTSLSVPEVNKHRSSEAKMLRSLGQANDLLLDLQSTTVDVVYEHSWYLSGTLLWLSVISVVLLFFLSLIVYRCYVARKCAHDSYVPESPGAA
jgi:hypothetical protein